MQGSGSARPLAGHLKSLLDPFIATPPGKKTPSWSTRPRVKSSKESASSVNVSSAGCSTVCDGVSMKNSALPPTHHPRGGPPGFSAAHTLVCSTGTPLTSSEIPSAVVATARPGSSPPQLAMNRRKARQRTVRTVTLPGLWRARQALGGDSLRPTPSPQAAPRRAESLRYLRRHKRLATLGARPRFGHGGLTLAPLRSLAPQAITAAGALRIPTTEERTASGTSGDHRFLSLSRRWLPGSAVAVDRLGTVLPLPRATLYRR